MNDPQWVRVTAADRRALRVPWRLLVVNKLKEFWIKGTGRRIPGQGMIGAGPEAVRDGFGSLAGKTFDGYNLPQQWVESRMLPQVIEGRVPVSGARVLDLGCGPGTSTRILAWFAKPDWRIEGLELIDHQVALAKERVAGGWFVNRDGERIEPTFRCADVSEPDAFVAIEDGSVDLAVSGGVVGLYLTPEQGERLIGALRRVVRVGGWVALDAGPSIPVKALEAMGRRNGFEVVDLVKSFPIEPRPKVLFRRGG